jgi:hypothetical protein
MPSKNIEISKENTQESFCKDSRIIEKNHLQILNLE